MHDEEEQIKTLQQNVERLEDKLRASEQANERLQQQLVDLMDKFDLFSSRLDQQIGMKVSKYLNDNKQIQDQAAGFALKQSINIVESKVLKLETQGKRFSAQIEGLQNRPDSSTSKSITVRRFVENEQKLINLEKQLKLLSSNIKEVEQVKQSSNTVQNIQNQQKEVSEQVERLEKVYEKAIDNLTKGQSILERDIEELNEKSKEVNNKYKVNEDEVRQSVVVLQETLTEVRQQLYQQFYDKNWIDHRLKKLMDETKDNTAFEGLKKELDELKTKKIVAIGKKLEQLEEQAEADRKSLQDTLKAQVYTEQLKEDCTRQGNVINQILGDLGKLKKKELSTDQVNRMLSKQASDIREDIINKEIGKIQEKSIIPLQNKLNELRKKVDADKKYEEWFRLFPSANDMQHRLDQLERRIGEAKQLHAELVSNGTLEDRLKVFKEQFSSRHDKNRQSLEGKIEELKINVERLAKQQLNRIDFLKTVQEEFDISKLREDIKSLRVEFNRDLKPFAGKLSTIPEKEQLDQTLDQIREELEVKIDLHTRQIAQLPKRESLEEINTNLGLKLKELQQVYTNSLNVYQDKIDEQKSDQEEISRKLSKLDQALFDELVKVKKENIESINKTVQKQTERLKEDIAVQKSELQALQEHLEKVATDPSLRSIKPSPSENSAQEIQRAVIDKELQVLREDLKNLQQQHEILQSQINKTPNKEDIIADVAKIIESESGPLLKLINKNNEEEIFPQFDGFESDIIDIKKKLNIDKTESVTKSIDTTSKPQVVAKEPDRNPLWQALEFFTAQPNIDGVFPQSKLSTEFIPRKNFYRIVLDSESATIGNLFLVEDNDTLSIALNAPDTYLTACEFRTIDKHNFDRSRIQPGEVEWDGKNWRVSNRIVIQ